MSAVSDDWWWACDGSEPAADKFIIANGKKELCRRLREELGADEKYASASIQQEGKPLTIEDVLDLLLISVFNYRVNQNRFMFEAAKIPVFAKFLRNAKYGLGNYVSNDYFPNYRMAFEQYSCKRMRQLGYAVSRTLSCDPDWF
jgi:hypothetical protein